MSPDFDADLEAEQPYIVTRYVPGPSLDAHVKEHGTLSAEELLRLGRGLAEALRSLHEIGVVHRDLKPGNVLMVDGRPVVIDFGIAQVAAAAGHPVRLFDIAPAAAQRAIDDLARRLRQRVDGGKADAATTEALLARLERADSLEQLADCALVIEAVAENLAIKQGLFRDLEALCSPTTLFASNTSSLSITAIAGALQHPERMAGLHFFNPVPVLALVEVIRGLQTSDETVARTMARLSSRSTSSTSRSAPSRRVLAFCADGPAKARSSSPSVARVDRTNP